MSQPEASLTRPELRAPRAAAIAGILLVFPLWVPVVSLYILIDNRRGSARVGVTGDPGLDR